MKNKNRQYYIECLDMGTNEVVSRALGELSESTDTEYLETTSDMDVKVYRTPYSLIQRLQASLNEFPSKFRVWYRDSETARLCQWTFHKKRKPSSKAIKAAADLKKIKGNILD